ncbi:MAG: type ISP restriction/modification enzyme [Candidatus Kapaibacteriota bacterium]
MLKDYVKNICETATKGDAREESFYPALMDFLERYCQSTNRNNISITVLPKKTEAGNPDFKVWDGSQHITGYIEAKEPGKNLDSVEDSEQIKRYRETFPNLILTNFLEFRLYRNGLLIDKVLIGRPVILHKLKTVPPVEKEPEFMNLFEKFFSFSIPRVYDAKTLAVELAKRTRFLKEIINQQLKESSPEIKGFYEAFERFLISDLTEENFSDLYAQTVTYGLFAARTRSHNGFNRKLAYYSIPHTIGILRDLFRFISLGDLPKQMEWCIDDISEVLAITDVYKILDDYFHEHKGSDPIVHFYETFLSVYDPETREKRGVYYTPEPVVSYIVRSINEILKDLLGKPDGLASKGVTLLDPAAGTLTFPAEASRLAVDEFTKRYGEGGKDKFIKEHILKNFYAFELMMAPYAIGHLKISFLLEEIGYNLKENDRFKLYLTNALEMEELEQTSLPGMASLSEESHLAGEVKKERPILVILGNPPYSGHSSNVGEWISKEIREYYQVDGKPLKEKNPKWLQDDYVKFIRFAQWKIEQAGEGILGFITNHSYLDNPTFRGMRQSLMKTFNQIYLLDLHGNSKKKERTPDGGKDENVFDIQQGVAIGIFVKTKSKEQGSKVFHSEIWGLREEKYEWLKRHDITNTRWKSLRPKSEFYLFIPRDERLLKQYETYPKITEIFPVNSVGIVTARDEFAIAFEQEILKRRLRQFIDKKLSDEIIRQTYNLNDTDRFKLSDVRNELMKEPDLHRFIFEILYRPFDQRWIFYHDAVVERSRKEVMQHMLLGENLGLITIRRSRSSDIWRYVFVTDKIIAGATAITALDINYLFPLYLYQKTEKPKKKTVKLSSWLLFEPGADYYVKKPNISDRFMERLTGQYKKTPAPEEILSYIYAVLYSNTYRTRYAEFLKIDFPRIPFAKGHRVFSKMAELGSRLIDLHLMRVDIKPEARFQGRGDNRVEKLRHEKERLYINSNQYFEGIEESVFKYHIGGYQVLEKWLKDRKGKTLSLDEIQTYCRIVTAIKETVQLQKEIDKIYWNIDVI